MAVDDLRKKFIDFYVHKKHKVLPNVPLVPENDPTTLFINSGVQPIEPYLTGKKHPLGKRLCSIQRCVRTDDIEDVGDSIHHTFFEMLGNWSLGDYFKSAAISWSYEFLTEELGLNPTRLWVTIFEGDQDSIFDEESKKVWLGLGIPADRIIPLGKEDNWWGPAGITGPCGPDTEVFFDRHPGEPLMKDAKPGSDSYQRFSEVWNIVFSQYYKDSEGNYSELKQKNVDTGLGLERVTAIVNGFSDNYQTELFKPIIEGIEKFTVRRYPRQTPFHYEKIENVPYVKDFRIIADHIRACVFIAADGVQPSNTEQGYVLRRLIRSAIRHGRVLQISENFMGDLAQIVIDNYRNAYPHLCKGSKLIIESITKEEGQFRKTLEKGLREFNKVTSKTDKLTGRQVFDLYQSYGFPIEMTVEMAKIKGVKVDRRGFEREFKKHQEMSRAAAKGRFAGGLADHSKETTRLHTATHLLHQALRDVLGTRVRQTGSNITRERLRFDFSYSEKLPEDKIRKIESIVNQKIKEDLPVGCKLENISRALEEGALAFFKDKYEGKVNVFNIGDYSKEVCGGPHVKRTGELGRFKIVKEKSIGKGIRRIRAILE